MVFILSKGFVSDFLFLCIKIKTSIFWLAIYFADKSSLHDVPLSFPIYSVHCLTTPLYFLFTKRQPNPFLSSNNRTLFWHANRMCQLLVLICAPCTKNTFWGLVPGPETVSSLFQLQIWHSYAKKDRLLANIAKYSWRNEFWISPCILRDNCTALQLSLIHIWRCRRSTLCRSRWSPYH